MLRYVDQFLSFRCAGDVIGVVGPMKGFSKEISEAMAIVRRIKPIIIKESKQWTLLDLCSGNALVPVITAFTLPTVHNYAIDKRERSGRRWAQIRNFTYLNNDIYSQDVVNVIRSIPGPIILTSVHPCKGLAERVVDIYNNCDNIEKLFLMPCCVGKVPMNIADKVQSQMNRDNLWGLYLALKADGRLTQDNHIISPKNRLVIADKHGYTDTRTEESFEGRILCEAEGGTERKPSPSQLDLVRDMGVWME
jgi:hypothetical protein